MQDRLRRSKNPFIIKEEEKEREAMFEAVMTENFQSIKNM